MELKQSLRLTQQLVMTPQLQQAIRLLQLTRMELVDAVHEEMLENPLLEDAVENAQEQKKEREEFDVEGRSEATLAAMGETEVPGSERVSETQAEVHTDGQAMKELDWASYLEDQSAAPPMPSRRAGGDDLPLLEATLTRRRSLFDHLLEQLNLTRLTAAEKAIGTAILGNLDVDGYLRTPPFEELVADLGVTPEAAERVLVLIQRFDPVGVAARSVMECLLVQAEARETRDDLVIALIRLHLDDLAKRSYQAIARELGEPLEEVYEAVRVIRELDPRPGLKYSSDEPRYITPDVYVHKVGDKYFVVANDDGLPRLKISTFYRTALTGSGAARTYVQDKLRSAQWFIRAIQQRQRTIVRVTESILKFQAQFFEKGIEHLRPLILRDIAEDISMHESTISRVTSNKYVLTPQGIFELKFFFNAGISATEGEELASGAVKSKIRSILSAEDPCHPLSDQQIVALLLEQKVDIARRTVAKYREQLGVPSSARRKKLF